MQTPRCSFLPTLPLFLQSKWFKPFVPPFPVQAESSAAAARVVGGSYYEARCAAGADVETLAGARGEFCYGRCTAAERGGVFLSGKEGSILIRRMQGGRGQRRSHSHGATEERGLERGGERAAGSDRER